MLDAVLELSHVLSAQGKLDEAEGVVRTALGARREAHGADDEKTRGALRELAALVGSRKKDSRAAVPLLRLADHVDIVTVEEGGGTDFPAAGAPEYLARHGVKARLHS